MRKELAARRLSAALGKKIDEDDVIFAADDGTLLVGDQVYALVKGNAAYVGNGEWMKNGRPWVDPEGVQIVA
jgi:hypothetical protein